jgi:hypothetical protein
VSIVTLLAKLITTASKEYQLMSSILKKIRFTLLLVFLLNLVPAFAQWTSRLENGGEVVVDPTSNRATVTRGGVSTPLWDGVHRLEDGTTLTVRSGQVVPNQDILRARKSQPAVTDPAASWVGSPIIGLSPCEQLVNHVCGVNHHCNDDPACGPARQLLEMEREERSKSGQPKYMTYSSGQCKEAARDTAFFHECPR